MSDGFADENLADFLALGAGLVRHEHLAEHLGSEVASLGRGVAKMHAALEAVLERPLAASACVDLGLDDDLSSELRSNGLGFIRSKSNRSGLGREAKFGEKLTRLVFVDVHSGKRKRDSDYQPLSRVARNALCEFCTFRIMGCPRAS